MSRFVRVALAALFLLTTTMAAYADPTSPVDLQPLHLEGYGLSAQISGSILLADGYADAYNNNWVTNVSIKFYVYKQDSAGRWRLHRSSSELFGSRWYVHRSWQSPSLSPGVYEVRARHREYTNDGHSDTWSTYPVCFYID